MDNKQLQEMIQQRKTEAGTICKPIINQILAFSADMAGRGIYDWSTSMWIGWRRYKISRKSSWRGYTIKSRTKIVLQFKRDYTHKSGYEITRYLHDAPWGKIVDKLGPALNKIIQKELLEELNKFGGL